MTLHEIAADLGITDSALRYAIRRKELTAIKAGTTWVVEDAEYARFREHRRKPGWQKGKPRKQPAPETPEGEREL